MLMVLGDRAPAGRYETPLAALANGRAFGAINGMTKAELIRGIQSNIASGLASRSPVAAA